MMVVGTTEDFQLLRGAVDAAALALQVAERHGADEGERLSVYAARRRMLDAMCLIARIRVVPDVDVPIQMLGAVELIQVVPDADFQKLRDVLDDVTCFLASFASAVEAERETTERCIQRLKEAVGRFRVVAT